MDVPATLFAYVATSAFVLQSMNGLSPIAYSVDFAVNAAGMTVAALVAARLVGRIATRTVILAGQLAALAAGLVMLAGALWWNTPLPMAIVCFFVLMTAQGLIGAQRRGAGLGRGARASRHRFGDARFCAVAGGRHDRPDRRSRRRGHRRTDGTVDDRRGRAVDGGPAGAGPPVTTEMSTDSRPLERRPG
ncbi:hypothetical protein GCM10009828_095270 [Actinoplanes couchii]|uniref:Major facilitator superfamily (MFS) profile domain-containing protein n=1 Tax=Actinoplanes couchii TaxID=403638 RepID=A0ABQ3XT62_9ACTN|nr:hypothetical protein Aco03nite_099560 [Actinoplanes couchii]